MGPPPMVKRRITGPTEEGQRADKLSSQMHEEVSMVIPCFMDGDVNEPRIVTNRNMTPWGTRGL